MAFVRALVGFDPAASCEETGRHLSPGSFRCLFLHIQDAQTGIDSGWQPLPTADKSSAFNGLLTGLMHYPVLLPFRFDAFEHFPGESSREIHELL